MRLIRALNSKVIDRLRDHLIADRDYPVDQQIGDLKDFMNHYPESFLALTLWDDSEEDVEVKAFVLAYIPPGRKHLFIVQAWADPETYGTEWPHEMFREMKRFAEENELTEIRGETTRSPSAFLKRWGFEPYSTILAYVLDVEVQ